MESGATAAPYGAWEKPRAWVTCAGPSAPTLPPFMYVSSTVSVNTDRNSPGLPASLSFAYAPKRSMMANRSAALSEASPGAFTDGGVAMSGEDES